MLETERLLLRAWNDEDADAYWRLNQDARVTEFLPPSLTMEQAKEFIAKQNNAYQKHGYMLFAAELMETGELMGFIGLHYVDWGAEFTPCTEIGWRLGSRHWGKGYATEGAKAVLAFGFNTCGLTRIVSFTVPENVRSIRVMEKIGMKRDFNGDFAHPKLPADHPLSKHVRYVL
jgi:RimJ/RimL family protein N-acetyltransferase